MAVLLSVPKLVWVFSQAAPRTPHPLSHGRHDLIISRRPLSESDILTTIKGFGIAFYPQGPLGILDYYKALGKWEIWEL